VRSRLRVESFDGGVAVLSVDASAGGLPAHKLLGLAAGRIESVLASKGLPAGSVQIRQDARIALDVQRLLAAKYPGTVVTNMAFADGRVAFDTAA
jgi:prepilin-type processing-associated H-X9-DG protein